MIKRFVSGLAALAICAGLLQCKRDDVVLTGLDTVRAYDIAMPLFNANIGAKDLLSRLDTTKYIYVDDNGLIHFQVDSVFEVEYTQIIEFDNIELDRYYDMGSFLKSTQGQVVFFDTIQIAPSNDQRLDSLLVKDGIMSVLLESPAGITGNYTLEFPDIRLPDGTNLTYAGQLGQNGPISKDLDAALFAIFVDYEGYSSMSFKFTVDYDTPTVPPSNTNVHLNIKVDPLVPEILWGFMGNKQVIDINENILMGMYTDLELENTLQFKGLSLALELHNYFGVPFEVTFDSMVFKNTNSQQEVELQFLESNKLSVDAAEFNIPVVPAIDSNVIDQTNSNLDDVVNIFPNELYMGVSGETNPNGATEQNFIANQDENKLYLHVKFRVPFWFKTSEYNRTDTVGFDVQNLFSDSTMIDYLDYIQLYFDFENGFPFNISTQAYFADDNNRIIDSLFFCQGPTDENCDGEGRYLIWEAGTVQDPGVTKVDVLLEQEKVKKLYEQHSTQIFINTRVSTGPIEAPDFVQIKEDNYIKIRFAFELKSQSTKL